MPPAESSVREPLGMRRRYRRLAVLMTSLALGAGGWWLARPETAGPEGRRARVVCEEAVGTVVGHLDDPALREVSGLVASRSQDVLWVHNDSGDGARVYAIDRSGVLRATVDVQGAEAFDWEDVALGPGRTPGGDDVHVGDIGDNKETRDAIAVYRFPEPVVAPGPAQEEAITAGPAERLDLRYPDGPHDAETLLVDPVTGDLFVVTKDMAGRSGVYRVAAPLAPGPGVEMEHVATLDLGIGGLATGGDISPSGDVIAVRTYFSVLVWGRSPGESVGDALARRPCARSRIPELQGEAIGFAADEESYLTTSEGEGSRVHLWSPDPDAEPAEK